MKTMKLTVMLLFFGIPKLGAQPVDTLVVLKAAATITFDGMPFEEAWAGMAPLPMVVFTPKYKADASERTEIRLAHDGEYLYIAGKLYDSEPEAIQGNSLIRDFNTAGDFFNVCIDSFNDNETYWYFGTMPSGNRLDAEIPNDAETDFIFNQSWNTFWDVKTAITEQGWFVEMRIPFSSLRFKAHGEVIILGFSVNRLIGRKFERHVFPDIPPHWPAAVWKASQAQKIRIEGVDEKKPLYITPYVLGGFSREKKQDVTPEVAGYNKFVKKEAGLDLKLGIASNYTLDISLNTDFAQVEADDFQANLSRFSLFFPEKRQFFQERAGVFSFETSGLNRLFNSRVIGLTPAGRPVRVYGGIRFVGRAKGNDLGILSMQTQAPDSMGSENYSIARYRRRIFNKNSYIGAIALSKIDEMGNYNFSYGLDGQIRVHAQHFLTLKAGQSVTSGDDGYFMYGMWEKRAFKGLGFSVEVDKTSDDFNPGLGFILRRNLLLGQKTSYGILPEKSKYFQAISTELSNTFYYRNSDAELETRNTKFNTVVNMRNGSYWNIGYQHIFDAVQIDFSISENVMVPAGKYNYGGFLLGYRTNVNGNFRVASSLEVGRFYSGKNYIMSVAPSWNPSKHLELQAGYTYQAIDFGHQGVRADIGTLKALVAFDLKWSVSTLLQYNKISERLGVNARLRFNTAEGRDLFLVFNQLNDVRSGALNSTLPGVNQWSLFIKYTHAFNLTR